jgi:hypothetical protein
MNSFFLDLLQGSKRKKRESVTNYTLTTNRCFHLPNGEQNLSFFTDSQDSLIRHRKNRRISIWYFDSLKIFRDVIGISDIEFCLHPNYWSLSFTINHKLIITIERMDFSYILSLNPTLQGYKIRANFIKRMILSIL